MNFSFNRPLELPLQLQWKWAHEPALLDWSIRARNYNTLVANGMFLFMATLAMGGGLIMYAVYEGMDEPWRTLSSMLFLLFCLFATSCMTHQRMNFAYRFTQSGVEYCKWKEFPKWALILLNCFAGTAAVICLSLASTEPAFLMGALIGSGGIGLTYLAMVNSKSYQASYAQYHHHEIKWTEITRLATASNRDVVDLKYKAFEEGDPLPFIGNLNLFCRRRQKYEVAEFIKPYLPKEADFIVARVNVPMSIY